MSAAVELRADAGHDRSMLELLIVIVRGLTLALRGRRELVLENLARRQQLAAMQRAHKRVHLQTRDSGCRSPESHRPIDLLQQRIDRGPASGRIRLGPQIRAEVSAPLVSATVSVIAASGGYTLMNMRWPRCQ